MFNIRQANFKSAHLLNKMALIQFQSNRTVILLLNQLIDGGKFQSLDFCYIKLEKIYRYIKQITILTHINSRTISM